MVNAEVADSHLVEIHPALDALNAERRVTCPVNVRTRVGAAVWAAPPQNVSSVVKKVTSLVSAPREVATSASTARRRVTSPGTVPPSGK